MKKMILSLAFILSLSATAFAQTALPDNPVTFAQIKAVQDRGDLRVLTGNGITQYTASNGAVIKIGDKLRIDRPEGGSKTFVSVRVKPLIMMGYSFDSNTSSNGKPDTSIVTIAMSNTELTVKAFHIIGTRKLGFKPVVELSTCAMCMNLIADLELGIENKELKTNGLTPDEALALLKTEKEKLDLGVITQAQYDAKKAELVKYIQKG